MYIFAIARSMTSILFHHFARMFVHALISAFGEKFSKHVQTYALTSFLLFKRNIWGEGIFKNKLYLTYSTLIANAFNNWNFRYYKSEIIQNQLVEILLYLLLIELIAIILKRIFISKFTLQAAIFSHTNFHKKIPVISTTFDRV